MLKGVRVYKEVGFDGMMMPDHVPKVQGRCEQLPEIAFAFGYVKAFIVAVLAE
jgi:mannonate dehydratase